MEEQDKNPVRILDRRHFTREGDRRKEEEIPPEEKPVAIGQPASAAASSPAPAPEPKTEPEKPGRDREPGQPSVFTELVLSLSTSCYMSLGQIPEPSGGLSEVNLEAAASYIDILEMLALKTRGNLDPYEKDVLDKILYELRLVYVQVRQKIGP
ncbi:MAG: DUF1844 domain-containing protein [Acidobacteriota bacterium]